MAKPEFGLAPGSNALTDEQLGGRFNYSVLYNDAPACSHYIKERLSALLMSVFTANLQAVSQGYVRLIVMLAHVIQKAATLAHQAQQPAAR